MIRRVPVNGIELACERFGAASDPCVLLIMGSGAQLLWWPERLCADLVVRGFFVVRYDNRDVGESTHFAEAGEPDAEAIARGDQASLAYGLDDMAQDAVGLLDALDVASAHVVGASMGGMIGQLLAIDHAERVRSLTSIMSSPHWSTASVTSELGREHLRTYRPPRSREEAIELALRLEQLIGAPGLAIDRAWVAETAGRCWDRDADAAGPARHLAACEAAPDRTAALAAVTAPTVVVHGAEDPTVPVEHGRATAQAIPGAELEVVPGMGHGLPDPILPALAAAIERAAARGDALPVDASAGR